MARVALEMSKGRQSQVWPAAIEKLKIRWTTDSNALEGSSLTFGDTLFFLQEGLTVKGKPFKDYLDARNHADAVEMLFDVVADGRPVSVGLVKEINALLMSGVRETPAVDGQGRRVMKPTTPGEFKIAPNHVLRPDGEVHLYVEPLQVPGQMEQMCQWVDEMEGGTHPVIIAAIIHFNMVRIHPFDDGNGRGARILMNLILMKAGFPPAVIRNERREEYFNALRIADQADLSPFITFVAKSVADTQDQLLEDLKG